MQVIKTPIEGLLIIKPRVFADARGFFLESYNEARYREAGVDAAFCQDNLSKSQYGVIRGLHYQLAPHSQSKLVSVVQGVGWYRDWETDRKSTRLNSSHITRSRMPSSA